MPDPGPEDGALEAILDAALPHVPFDGWGPATVAAAVADAGVAPALARALLPRGGVDLAAAFHRRGDRLMAARLARADLSGLRFRDRIAAAVRIRLEVVADAREAVRRGVALFALPHHAAEGAALIWGTADAIWTALGDRSEDGNWYSKRATLAAVWAATVLYWLGDQSPGETATAAFLDRRIADVMRIEDLKGWARRNPLTRPFAALPDWLFARIPAPARAAAAATADAAAAATPPPPAAAPPPGAGGRG